MKITLDISRLVEEGKLTRDEADRLPSACGAGDRVCLVRILVGVRRGRDRAGARAPTLVPLTVIGFGVVLFVAVSANSRSTAQHGLLGQICLVIGALTFDGGVIAYRADLLASVLIVTGAFLLASSLPLEPPASVRAPVTVTPPIHWRF